MERVKQVLKYKLATISFFLFGTIVFACGPFYPTVYHSPTGDGPISLREINPTKGNQFFKSYQSILNLVQMYKTLAGKPLNTLQRDPSDNYISYDSNQPTPEDIWRSKIKGYDTIKADDPNDFDHNFYVDDVYITDSIQKFDKFKTYYSKADFTEWVKNQDKMLLAISDVRQQKYEANQNSYSSTPDNSNTNQIDQPSTTTLNSGSNIKNFFLKIYEYILNFFGHAKVENVNSENQNNSKRSFNVCAQDTCDLIIKYNGELQQDYIYQQARLAEYKRDDFLVDKIYRYILQDKKNKYYSEAKFRLAKYYLLTADPKSFNTSDSDLLGQARVMFAEILADKNMNIYHQDADNYIYMIDGGKPSVELLNKRAGEVLESNGSGNYIRSYTDFHDMYGSLVPYDNDLLTDFKKSIVSSSSNQMFEWMVFWQYGSSTDIDLIKGEYKKYPNDAWLLLSIRYINPSDNEFTNIENKILNLNKNSIIFYTANYYLIQKYIQTGQLDKANHLLDKIEINYEGRLGSPENNAMYDNFKYLRMLASNDLVSFFKNSNRYVVVADNFMYGPKNGDAVWTTAFMDDTAKEVFEQYLTLDEQVQLIYTDGVFKSTKNLEFLKMLAFNRAIILQRYDVADKLAKDLVSNNSSLDSDYGLYLNATTKAQKEYFGKFIMLRYASVANYVYDDPLFERKDIYYYDRSSDGNLPENASKIPLKDLDIYTQQHWAYCSRTDDYPSTGYDSNLATTLKNILTQTQIDNAKSEFKVVTLDNSVQYFGDTVFEYYKNNPKESTIPEAMYLLVLDSRYGCLGGVTYDSNYNRTDLYNTESAVRSEYSKKAFDILHYNFPNTSWTKNTPYHF